jgi:integrase
MANLTLAVLSKLMAYAIKAKVRRDNPFAGLERYKGGTYHTWTEAEIAQFEQRWEIGTRERLAFALLLYTGQRGGDVCKMTRSDIVNGSIRVVQDKARKGEVRELMIPIHPELARALKAGPVVGMHHLITNAKGKPYSALTDMIEAAVGRAGLPDRCVAHGLRKAVPPRSRSRPSPDTRPSPWCSSIPRRRIKRRWRHRPSPSSKTGTRRETDLLTSPPG